MELPPAYFPLKRNRTIGASRPPPNSRHGPNQNSQRESCKEIPQDVSCLPGELACNLERHPGFLLLSHLAFSRWRFSRALRRQRQTVRRRNLETRPAIRQTPRSVRLPRSLSWIGATT